MLLLSGVDSQVLLAGYNMVVNKLVRDIAQSQGRQQIQSIASEWSGGTPFSSLRKGSDSDDIFSSNELCVSAAG